MTYAIPYRRPLNQDFLLFVGWIGLFLLLVIWSAGFIHFLYPEILYEPSPKIEAGTFKEYLKSPFTVKAFPPSVILRSLPEGSTASLSQPIFVLHNDKSIYGLHGICTKCWCPLFWIKQDNRFRCATDGSNFDLKGNVVAGPAPLPLARLGISSRADKIIVDLSKKTWAGSDRESDSFLLHTK